MNIPLRPPPPASRPAQTRFQKALRGVMERGGVVGGTSAGTAAIPEVMTMWEERRHSQAPALAVPSHGLGLLTRAIVEQQFDARVGRTTSWHEIRTGESAKLASNTLEANGATIGEIALSR